MMMMIITTTIIIIIIIIGKSTCNWNICVYVIYFFQFLFDIMCKNVFMIRDKMTLEERKLSIIYVSSQRMIPTI